MAEEAKEAAPPANAEGATTPAAEGEAGPKKSGIAKLLSNKIALAAIALVLVGAIGGGVMFFMKSGKKKESKKVSVAKQEAHAEAKEEKKEEKPKEEKPKEEKKEETKQEGGGEAAPKEGEAAAEGGEGEGGEGQALVQMKFDPVIANVVEKNSLHYLKMQLVFDCSNANVVEEIKSKSPQLRDALLFMINDMTLRELLSSGGKALLKEDIVSEFNKNLSKGKIVKVYLSDFTVQ